MLLGRLSRLRLPSGQPIVAFDPARQAATTGLSTGAVTRRRHTLGREAHVAGTDRFCIEPLVAINTSL